MAKKDIHALDLVAARTPVDGDTYREFLETLKDMHVVHARVQRPIRFARIVRPGDDAVMRRLPEPTVAGDIVQIPMDLQPHAAQSPGDVALLFTTGDITPVTKAEFDGAQAYSEIEAEREEADARGRASVQDVTASLEARIVTLEAQLAAVLKQQPKK